MSVRVSFSLLRGYFLTQTLFQWRFPLPLHCASSKHYSLSVCLSFAQLLLGDKLFERYRYQLRLESWIFLISRLSCHAEYNKPAATNNGINSKKIFGNFSRFFRDLGKGGGEALQKTPYYLHLKHYLALFRLMLYLIPDINFLVILVH